MTMACVYWIKDSSTGLVTSEDIPEEQRYVGAICRVRFTDGETYPAEVVAISDDKAVLEKAENDYLEALRAKLMLGSSIKTGRGKRTIKPSLKAQSTAKSEKQVAAALGEKPPLGKKQQEAKRKQDAGKRDQRKKLHRTERQDDMELLGLKNPPQPLSTGDKQKDATSLQRILPSSSHGDSSTVKARPSTLSDSVSSIIKTRPTTPSQPFPTMTDEKAKSAKLDSEELDSDEGIDNPYEMDAKDDEIETEKHGDSSNVGKILIKHNNPAVREFIWDLAGVMGMDLKTDFPRKTSKEQIRILQPLPVPEGQIKVELVAKSGLWLSKAVRSNLLIASDNDPYKLARKTVQDLYGKETLRQGDVTAVGLPGGGCGIGTENLTAIYKFVQRNSPWNNPPNTRKGKKRARLSFTLFTREVNRTIISLRRTQFFKPSSKNDESPGASSDEGIMTVAHDDVADTQSKALSDATEVRGSSQASAVAIKSPDDGKKRRVSPDSIPVPPKQVNITGPAQNVVPARFTSPAYDGQAPVGAPDPGYQGPAYNPAAYSEQAPVSTPGDGGHGLRNRGYGGHGLGGTPGNGERDPVRDPGPAGGQAMVVNLGYGGQGPISDAGYGGHASQVDPGYGGHAAQANPGYDNYHGPFHTGYSGYQGPVNPGYGGLDYFRKTGEGEICSARYAGYGERAPVGTPGFGNSSGLPVRSPGYGGRTLLSTGTPGYGDQDTGYNPDRVQAELAPTSNNSQDSAKSDTVEEEENYMQLK